MWRILIIEDDEIDREAVRRALADTGKNISILEARDGRAGLSALTYETVDCVILDFMLPDMNGLEFLKTAQDKSGKLPFSAIMLTGEGNEEVAVDAMKLGVYDYVVKGSQRYADGSLINVVERAIGNWTLIRDKELAERQLKAKALELELAMAAAEKANKAKSEFLAAMSHDLRTPLNAIIGFSDMMRTEAFGPVGNIRYQEYATDIFDSGNFLVGLINDILDLSKIEAGKYDLLADALDIPAVIQMSFRQLAKMAESSNQSLTLDRQADVPTLLGDERALLQILNNLLSNAIKFSSKGQEIVVTTTIDQHNGIVIKVTDCGIGMSPKEVTKALQPFEQADSLHSRRHHGTGLGLHLCSNLMTLFGGSLKIDSEPNKGTTVTLTFPSERTIPHPQLRSSSQV